MLLLRINIIIALISHLCDNYVQGERKNIICQVPSVILYCYQFFEIPNNISNVKIYVTISAA